MGPFSYIAFMECNHAILSMKNIINGSIHINNDILNFNNDIGYIEKLSIADIPFKVFKFRGIICTIIIDNKEYRFATYNNTKLIEYDIANDSINITLKKGKYYLNIKSTYNIGHKLSAPVKGKMEKDIFESINSLITVTLKYNDNIIFSDTSINCGLEIVRK